MEDKKTLQVLQSIDASLKRIVHVLDGGKDQPTSGPIRVIEAYLERIQKALANPKDSN